MTRRPSTRGDDLARLCLAGRNSTTSAHLDELFRGEYWNPMLGIYGGHLLLLEKQVDRELLARVVAYLERVFDQPGPFPRAA